MFKLSTMYIPKLWFWKGLVEDAGSVREKEPCFGKGVSQLLHLCDEYGSLSKACEVMGMSHSKAWKILKRAEEDLDMKLLERVSGGSNGGGSVLSEEGKTLLKKYDEFQKRMKDFAEETFQQLFYEER